jgi:hypothetical protein
VEDLVQPAIKPTCKSVYLATVLFDAAELSALSPAQVQALEQLLPSWVSSANLAAEIVADSSRSPLAIDLSADCGARLARTLQPVQTLRYIDATELAPRLRDLATAVRAGTLPLELPARALSARIERLLTHHISMVQRRDGLTNAERDSARTSCTQHARDSLPDFRACISPAWSALHPR